jgi:hypothetical protein
MLPYFTVLHVWFIVILYLFPVKKRIAALWSAKYLRLTFTGPTYWVGQNLAMAELQTIITRKNRVQLRRPNDKI